MGLPHLPPPLPAPLPQLGDPCCEWKEGDLPRRTWQLGHPGASTKIQFDRANAHDFPGDLSPDTGGLPMPDCKAILAAAAAGLKEHNV